MEWSKGKEGKRKWNGERKRDGKGKEEEGRNRKVGNHRGCKIKILQKKITQRICLCEAFIFKNFVKFSVFGPTPLFLHQMSRIDSMCYP